MQKSFVIRTAAAAIVAALLTPAAFAQSASRTQQYDPYAAGGRAPVCSQLELSVGLKGDECGKLSLNELAYIKADRDNTN